MTIIDVPAYFDDMFDIQDRFCSLAMRSRLRAVNGTAGNQIIPSAPGTGGLVASFSNPNSPDAQIAVTSVQQMDP